MMLIADSGSTKTDWRVISSDSTVSSFETIGLNPYFVSKEDVIKELNQHKKYKISELFFYGSGCGQEKQKNILHSAFSEIFSGAKMHIETDMMGAARALLQYNPGIAVILGTGSNSCRYDGINITSQQGSFGYIMGDDGSGAKLGLNFIKKYLHRELPDEIVLAFDEKYKLTTGEIIESVYKKSFPNRFLASFVPFLATYKKNPAIYAIVYDSFLKFLTVNILNYPDCNKTGISCTGSVSWFFSEILISAASHCNIQINDIVKSPIDGLVEFHKNYK